MLRTILKSNKNTITVELPNDLVGKMIEVVVFSIEDSKSVVKDIPSKEDQVAIVKKRLKKFTFNSGGYNFNHDDANDYN